MPRSWPPSLCEMISEWPLVTVLIRLPTIEWALVVPSDGLSLCMPRSWPPSLCELISEWPLVTVLPRLPTIDWALVVPCGFSFQLHAAPDADPPFLCVRLLNVLHQKVQVRCHLLFIKVHPALKFNRAFFFYLSCLPSSPDSKYFISTY